MSHFLAIDLKSYYASAECVSRGLDPLSTHLVVADATRTDKTICLAVSPSLKALGIGGRPRLFEVVARVRQLNAQRAARLGAPLRGRSVFPRELELHPDWAVDYIVAPPRMALYVALSRQIRQIYLRSVAPEDLHAYSVDEVFIDATPYLRLYRTDAEGLARRLVGDVLAETGITATAGVGTNLYLAKVAMDIEAKHMAPDADGVRLATLDEHTFRLRLWHHRPLTDFWRIGRGLAARLEALGITTMGQLARFSLTGEARLFADFGVEAELLIDHAWGCETTRMADIKAYRPRVHSLSSSQVLQRPYTKSEADVVVREMAAQTALDLTRRNLRTDQLTVAVGYDATTPRDTYTGPLVRDPYGRTMPKPSHATLNLERHTASARRLMQTAALLFREAAHDGLFIRRLQITAGRVITVREAARREPLQLDLFRDRHAEQERDERDERLQETIVSLRQRYGKNAILQGLNFDTCATQRLRNQQIGGHHE